VQSAIRTNFSLKFVRHSQGKLITMITKTAQYIFKGRCVKNKYFVGTLVVWFYRKCVDKIITSPAVL